MNKKEKKELKRLRKQAKAKDKQWCALMNAGRINEYSLDPFTAFISLPDYVDPAKFGELNGSPEYQKLVNAFCEYVESFGGMCTVHFRLFPLSTTILTDYWDVEKEIFSDG